MFSVRFDGENKLIIICIKINNNPQPRRHIEYLDGIKTLRTQDTSDLRHFGTGAEVSGHFGIGAEMSVRHFSRIGLAWRLCTRRNRFNAVYLKHDGTAIDWADRTAIVPVTVAQSPPSASAGHVLVPVFAETTVQCREGLAL